MKFLIFITLFFSLSSFAGNPHDSEKELWGTWAGPDATQFTISNLSPELKNQRWRCQNGIGLQALLSSGLSDINHPYIRNVSILEFRGDLSNALIDRVQRVILNSDGVEIARTPEFELRIVGNAAKARQFVVINQDRYLGALEKAVSLEINWGQSLIYITGLGNGSAIYSITKHCKLL